MLQRVQSIFLSLVMIAMLAFVFSKIWFKVDTATQTITEIRAFAVIQTDAKGNTSSLFPWSFILGGLALGAAASAFMSLISYKNRLRQMSLGLVNTVLIGSVLGLVLYITSQINALYPNSTGEYGVGLLLPAFSMVMNMLANRFIRKDEKLVRSADRMRD